MQAYAGHKANRTLIYWQFSVVFQLVILLPWCLLRLLSQLLFLIQFSWSQVDYSENWEDFYSYNNVKDFIKVDNDILKVFEAVIKLIENHDGELRSCINFRNCNPNNKVFKNFKKDRNILFRVKKRAVIGVFGIDKLLLKAFYLLDRNETKTFKTELEALNFLAQ